MTAYAHQTVEAPRSEGAHNPYSVALAASAKVMDAPALNSDRAAALAAARDTMESIVAEIHSAPEHLSGLLYPLAMQAAQILASMEAGGPLQ